MNQLTHKRVFADIPIYFYETVSSTQEIAKEALETLVNKNAVSPVLAVFSANHQINGKGRRSRNWESTLGSSLLCTYVIRAGNDRQWLDVARLMVSNVRVLTGLGCSSYLKWPNDIVEDSGKKLGGCLTEVLGEFLLVGIGINLKNSAYSQDLGNIASSLENFGVHVKREEFIESMLQNFHEDFDSLEEYKSLSHTIGKNVEIQQVAQKLSGEAIDVDLDGSLLLKTMDGQTMSIFEGDVVHARAKT